MRVLIAIGCDHYLTLQPLVGAERDAERVWRALTSPGAGAYDEGVSSLLLSPAADEVRGVLGSIPKADIDVLTFFFAGHGGVKAGSYYFCMTDADPNRLAISALPLTSLLAVISELQPRQANLVVDACQAGGGMFDFPAVLKRDALGEGETMGISVFAACGSAEYASEGESGGIATTRLVEYLDGTKRLHSTSAYLDLIELGRAVSEEIAATTVGQTPVSWGINLFGASAFATNPHFDQDSAAVAAAASLSKPLASMVVDAFGEELRELHRQLVTDTSPDQLVSLIHRIIAYVRDKGEDASVFIRGPSTSLRSVAFQSRNLFAEGEVVDCVLAVLLGRHGDTALAELASELAAERLEIYERVSPLLREQLQGEYSLVNSEHVLADLFFLPIRVSRVLGWVGSHMLTAHRMGAMTDEVASTGEVLTKLIVDKYGPSIAARSDVQAPPLFAFTCAAHVCGWVDKAEDVIGRVFCDLVSSNGTVARLGSGPKQIRDYLYGRATDPTGIHPRLLANPSSLLSTVLLCGVLVQLDEV